MHELSITEEVLKIVLEYAEENRAARVVVIHLQAGELRDLDEEWLQRYFDYLSRGTIAEGAKIALNTMPALLKCSDCDHIFNDDIRQDNIICPACESTANKLVGGDEFIIESIGVI